MSIQVTQTPAGILLSAGNDNIFCVSGNTIGAPNVFEYKYICDVFVNGVLQVTLKSFPDPQYNVGVFNIKNVINSFLGTDYFGFTSVVYNQCPNSSCRVFFEFGEEFMSGSTFVQNRDVNDTGTYIFVNSSIATAINIDSGGMHQYFPDGGSVSYLDGRANQGMVNFGGGLIFPQYINQYRFLYFVNNTQTGNNANTGVTLNIFTFDADDNEIGQYRITSPYDFSTANDVQAINVNSSILSDSAYTVISGPGTMFGNGETYYIANLLGDGDGNCQWSFVQLNISEDCGRFADQSYYIDWLNESGGFSSWLFNKKNETTQTKQVQKYKKIPGKLTAGGEFNLLTSDRNQQAYFTVLQDQTIMFSDFLSDLDVLYLKSLVSSPMVFIRSNAQSGLTTSATIEDNSYKINKRVNQKIYSLQLTVNQSFNDYRQQL